jgi:hypothetical protein
VTTGAVVWMAIFILSAAGFFAVAAVVSVLGVRDIQDLLRRHPDDSTRGKHDHG